jgi:hypothetical protein
MSRTITAVKNTAWQKWRRWLATTIVGLTLMLGSHFADAADALSIADFVGHFSGEAQAQASDRFFIQQLRDTDVDLRAEMTVSDFAGPRSFIPAKAIRQSSDNAPLRCGWLPVHCPTSSEPRSHSSRLPKSPRRGRISRATGSSCMH